MNGTRIGIIVLRIYNLILKLPDYMEKIFDIRNCANLYGSQIYYSQAMRYSLYFASIRQQIRFLLVLKKINQRSYEVFFKMV